jgi:hypothetical protein
MEAAQWRYDLQHATVIYPQIADLQFGRTDIYRHSWSDHAMATHQFRRYIDALPAPYKLRAVQLYQEGTDFLFGMLYRACFTLQPSLVRHDIGTRTTTTTTTTFSVALHSRHTVAADDGSFVKDEMACLRLLLSHHQRKTCRVYLMSDRPATLELIAKELSKMPSNCTVVTTDKNRVNAGTTSSLSREHGPWAGVGFLQDLELAAAARHGAVGDPHRSSFALLVKLMEYDRRMEALQWQHNDKDSLPALETCHLPARSVKGYDYGPGTPTFRHHSFLQPLEPVGLLQTFIKQHSIETTQLAELEQDGRNHRYMVAWLDCDLPVASRLYPVLNSTLTMSCPCWFLTESPLATSCNDALNLSISCCISLQVSCTRCCRIELLFGSTIRVQVATTTIFFDQSIGCPCTTISRYFDLKKTLCQ